MTKTLLSLCSILLFIAGCSGLQKRTCLQSAAFQHGYQAAQKGETVDGSSLYKGQVCSDFEEYPTSMYRNDFKAGWTKGKAEYCTSSNYVQWGNEDGELGRVEYPNNYSTDMKICLQDPDYKKEAMKRYKGGFIHSFCNPDRMEKLGQTQAKAFTAFKTPLIRKHCGKKSPELVAVMKKAYKLQMKANCTASYWMVKGEEDAKAKRSKSVEISKVQKCPANTHDSLVAQYSAAYNERKALMLQEEKLAFERQKEKERLEMEKEKQRQQYELERQRTQILSDAVNNTTGGGVNRGGGNFYGRPFVFSHRGNRVSVRCLVDTRRQRADVFVKNESSRYVSINGRWRIEYFNDRDRRVRTTDEYENLGLSAYEEERFDDAFAPHDAVWCSARLRR